MQRTIGAALLISAALLAVAMLFVSARRVQAADARTLTAVRQDAAPTAPTPTVVPQPTATPGPSLPAYIASASHGRRLHRLIGDRLSPTLYGLAENGWLYRSNNNGSTWAMATTAPLVRDFIMNAGNPYVLYGGAGLDCGAPTSTTVAPFYRSDDGGVTWKMMSAGRNLRPLLTNPANPEMVFAADCAMLYLSENGGRSWVAKPDVSAAMLWEQYMAVDMNAAALVGDPPPSAPSWAQVFALGVDDIGRGVLAFTGENGNSWVELTDGEQPPVAPVAVVAHQTQGGRLWVVTVDGVWTTTNYGIDWTFLKAGLPSTLHSGLHDLTYGPDGALYLATDPGLYILPPGAATWQFAGVKDVDLSGAKRLLLTETNPNELWVTTEDGVFRVVVSE